jgi:hypothetical protein
MIHPLVRDGAGDGLPVTVTCRVLEIVRQPCDRWLDCPVTDAEFDEAWLTNTIFDAALPFQRLRPLVART